jgi:uncharacterized protein YecE (DUF72 family)
MLAFYAERFNAVESNYTFRMIPKPETIAGWLEQTPEHFRFAPKASQAITHFKRLQGAEESTDALLEALEPLQPKLGPMLFQLPPNLKKDMERLEGFLQHLANRIPATFEFRHPSWHDDEVYDCLREHRAALCIADTVDLPMKEIIPTTDWGYLRLRSNDYTPKQLKAWVQNIQAQKWREAYVFFMHEDEATGPEFATKFMELTGK